MRSPLVSDMFRQVPKLPITSLCYGLYIKTNGSPLMDCQEFLAVMTHSEIAHQCSPAGHQLSLQGRDTGKDESGNVKVKALKN
jgi:hypothetical protein